MGDVSENVEINVGGAGELRDAAAAAEALAEGLAADGAAAAEATPEVEAFAKAAGSARDKMDEATAAAGLNAAATDALGAKYAQMAGMVDSARKRYEEFGRGLGTEGDKIRSEMEALEKDLTGGDLGRAQGSLGAGKALGDLEGSLGKLRSELEAAEPYIDSQSRLLDEAGRAAEDAGPAYEKYTNEVRGARAAMENFSETAKELDGSEESVKRLELAASEMDSQIQKAQSSGRDFADSFSLADGAARDAADGVRDAGRGFDDAGHALGDVEKVAKDAGQGLGDIGANVGGLANAFSGLGEAASSAMGPLTSIALPGAIVGGIAALTAAAPGVVALGASFGSLGVLALPALSKVKDGLTAVTQAQQAYTMAKAVEARDPTKSNLEAQQKALATLQSTWAQMPKPISAAVQSIQSFQHAFSKASEKSGIQKDILGDIPKAIKDAKDALPSLIGLAKTAAPVLNHMLGDIGSNLKSQQFKAFIHSIEKDVGPAASSFHRLAGAAGSFISTLQEKGGSAGTQFINSLSTLMKNSGPGAATGLVNTVNAMTKLTQDINEAKPGFQAFGDLLGGLSLFQSKGGQIFGSTGLAHLTDSVMNLTGLGKSGSSMKFEDSIYNAVTGVWHKIATAGLPKEASIAGQKAAQAYAEGINDPLKVKGFQQDAVKAAQEARKAMQAGLQGAGDPQKTRQVVGELRIRSKLDKPDTSALNAVRNTDVHVKVKIGPLNKSELQKSIQTQGLEPPKVPATAKVTKTDTSGVKATDAKVPATAKVDKVDTAGISGAAKRVQLHGVTVDLSNAKLSGLGALSSSLSSAGAAAGKAFDSGLSSAIQSGGAAAVGDARAIVSQIRGALAGMGAAGSAAGAALGAGLASGIRASTGAAVAAATAMANAVTSAVAKAHETQSPSKKFKKIGQDDVKGLILGLEGGKAQVNRAAKDLADGVTTPFHDKTITDHIKKLETDLTKALKDKQITAGEDTALTAWLKSDNTKLQGLAAQRASLETQIQGADSLFKSVQSSTIAGGNIATLAGSVTSPGQMELNEEQGNFPAPGAPNPPTSIQQGLKQYLGQVKAFRSDIVKLKSEGLDETSLKQLLQAGVTSGLPAAKMLLSGGAGGVKEVAKLQDELAKAAKQLGVTGANASYESGSEIGKGLASGLKASLSGVESSIKELAEAIGKALGGKTGKGLAQLGKDLGKDFGDGVGKGAKDAAHSVPIIRDKSGKVVSLGGGGIEHPMPILKGTTGPVGSQPIHVDVHVTLDGKEIANTTQTQTLQRAHRNTSSGLVLPGRRA